MTAYDEAIGSSTLARARDTDAEHLRDARDALSVSTHVR